MNRQFQHVNEEFNCGNCQRLVPKRSSSCRNHCPYCLTSKHVDINPGDRANSCQGLMSATGYQPDSHKALILFFKCQKFSAITRNIAAIEDRFAADNYDLILKLGPYSG